MALNSCSPFLKKMIGIKNPVVENTESITNHLIASKVPLQNSYIINCCSDSSNIFKNILNGLRGEIMLFDSTGLKYCYKGKDRCTGKQLKEAYYDFNKNYQPCVNDSIKLQAILSNAFPVNNDYRPLTNYYIIVFWAKFAGKKTKLLEDYKWMLSLKNNSSLSSTILFINADLQENWNLKKGKKMRIKFKLRGKKSAAIHFGKIPYNK